MTTVRELPAPPPVLNAHLDRGRSAESRQTSCYLFANLALPIVPAKSGRRTEGETVNLVNLEGLAIFGSGSEWF
jgi:hypothetical protein